MANTNCLKGMRCPNRACRSRGPFSIVGTAFFEVYDDGTADYHNVEWETTNACTCIACGTSRTVADFSRRTRPPVPPPAPLRYWVLTHEHAYGMSQTIFTHPTEPDLAVVTAYATRALDYEEGVDGEWITLEAADPFLTYAEIEATAKEP